MSLVSSEQDQSRKRSTPSDSGTNGVKETSLDEEEEEKQKKKKNKKVGKPKETKKKKNENENKLERFFTPIKGGGGGGEGGSTSELDPRDVNAPSNPLNMFAQFLVQKKQEEKNEIKNKEFARLRKARWLKQSKEDQEADATHISTVKFSLNEFNKDSIWHFRAYMCSRPDLAKLLCFEYRGGESDNSYILTIPNWDGSWSFETTIETSRLIAIGDVYNLHPTRLL